LSKAQKISACVIPAIFIAGYLFFWNAPKVNLQDPWYEAFSKVNAGMKTQDPVVKQQLLDRGGGALKELCKRYPYHARVHFFLGCYYEYTGCYDSAIVHAKEALRLGSGAEVNQVDDLATELLISSTSKLRALRAQGEQAGGCR
jgi:hypothetical protein